MTWLQIPGQVPLPPEYEQVVGHLIPGVGVGLGPPAVGGAGIVTVAKPSGTGLGDAIAIGVTLCEGTGSCNSCTS